MGLNCSLNKSSLAAWQDDDMEPMRYGYPIEVGDRVLDIGSYKREWGKRFEDMGAVVEYFDALDDRAAWIEDGTIKMGGAFYYTSYFEQGDTEYKCVDIAPFLMQETAVVKINIEGMEYALLKYIIQTGLIANIKHLQVQFHLIEGQPVEVMYADLVKELEKTHVLEWRYPFCWESWRRKTSNDE